MGSPGRPARAAGLGLAGLGLAALLAGCAAKPIAFALDADNFECVNKVEVGAERLGGDAALAIAPERLAAFYPDRARRMAIQGAASYACRREAGRTACALEDVAPSDYGFEYVAPALEAVVTPADGEVVRLRLTFKIVELGECRVQVARSVAP